MITITRPSRFLSFILFIIVILVIAILMLGKLYWGTAQLQKSGELVIEEGSSAGIIWQNLVTNNFTVRTTPWEFYAWRLDAPEKLKSGNYRLERGEYVRDVILRFMAGDVEPDELAITYPEGFTLEQMAARTASRGIETAAAFEAAASDKRQYLTISDLTFLPSIPANRTLEGYLFPDTYRVFPDDSASDVIKRMLGTMQARLTPLIPAIENSGRTIDQVIIMASIIEREVISDDDMALVSDVLWKRFDDGAGLAADATTRYALQKWDGPLTVQDLAIDSPYNTRKYRGLPPGPISNPGLRAIQAAIHPESSEHYYYLSNPAGETIFSTTLDEHNLNKVRHLK